MKTLIALLVALAATASPLLAQDVIKFKDPKKDPDLEGEIVGLSYRSVDIEIHGVAQTVDARKVAELLPGTNRKHFDFARGEEDQANGDTDAAIQRFERALKDTRALPLIRQLADISIVRCHASSENPAGVVEAAKLLRSRKPDSFYVGESYQREILAQLSTGNLQAAKASIAAFAAQARKSERDEWAAAATLLDARLMEAQNNWRAALAVYRRFAQDPLGAEEAALGELRCLTALRNFPGLKLRADGILKGGKGSSRLVMAAYTARGDVELDGTKVKEALLDYFYAAQALDKGEASDEHETALARTTLACQKLAQLETDPARKATYKTRSQEMLRTLLKAYPRSKYRKEIEQSSR